MFAAVIQAGEGEGTVSNGVPATVQASFLLVPVRFSSPGNGPAECLLEEGRGRRLLVDLSLQGPGAHTASPRAASSSL